MRAHCIYGPPGTGKTTTIIGIYRELLARKMKPENIGFLSHTKAAAQETFSRVKDELPEPKYLSTIHSMVYRLLEIDKSQVVTTSLLKEFSELVNVPITGKSPDSEAQLEVGDEYLAIYCLAIARQEDPVEAYRGSDRPGSLSVYGMFIETYEHWKEQNGLLDFNDMLLRYLDSPVNPMLHVLIIDEAQDLSFLQWEVVHKTLQHVTISYIAGDDDQSIYEWAGADTGAMQKYEKRYSAKRKILDQSYRVPRAIHALSQKIVNRIDHRVDKEYIPCDRDGEVIEHGNSQSIKWDQHRDTLVLYRNHFIRKEIEDQLIMRCIPYVAEGGMPGLIQNRFAKAIRIWLKVQDGGDITKRDIDILRRCGNLKIDKALNHPEGLYILKDSAWYNVLSVPFNWKHYYMDVHILTAIKEGTANIRLSSIHASKGKEADRVILHSGQSDKTVLSAMTNADAEHRVFYVGVTRAKNTLEIIHGENGYVF